MIETIDALCISTTLADPPRGEDLWTTCPLGGRGEFLWCWMEGWYTQPEGW